MALVVVCIASFGFQYNNLTGACRLLFQELLTKTSVTPVAWWRVNIERVTRRWDGRGRLKPVDTFLVIGIGVGCYFWSGSDDSRKFSTRMHLAAMDWHPVGQLPHLHGMLTLKPILVQVRLLRFYCQGKKHHPNMDSLNYVFQAYKVTADILIMSLMTTSRLSVLLTGGGYLRQRKIVMSFQLWANRLTIHNVLSLSVVALGVLGYRGNSPDQRYACGSTMLPKMNF
ncbi:uncharacterized protein EV154DRAFT_552328 [Mucor mucedo]|uniref:uncharacterized protein n=1 Tax=Mucor mucedo TaxID=29922 RepID=UPI00221EAC16|nr:uncharacterized protein EV154DRAFT_552328 [Mucor mucedo]KAI7890287.1 hypothetical protein EV154DRAFT_552328 [Mucor mucedo]